MVRVLRHSQKKKALQDKTTLSILSVFIIIIIIIIICKWWSFCVHWALKLERDYLSKSPKIQASRLTLGVHQVSNPGSGSTQNHVVVAKQFKSTQFIYFDSTESSCREQAWRAGRRSHNNIKNWVSFQNNNFWNPPCVFLDLVSKTHW